MKNEGNVGLIAKQRLEELLKNINSRVNKFYKGKWDSIYRALENPEERIRHITEVAINNKIRGFLDIHEFTAEFIEQNIKYFAIPEVYRKSQITQENYDKVLKRYGLNYEEFIFLGNSANSYIMENKGNKVR